jgi:hypothetical protein
MRYSAGITLLVLMVLLASGCTEQDAPGPYDMDLSENPNEVLVPTAPMDLDGSIMNADAGSLPEPQSAEATEESS